MSTLMDDTLIDVRQLPPRERHPRIFGMWEALPQGGALLLVNDHDPVPLYYQFAAEFEGSFHWEYLERGPETWQVRIAKGTFADPGFRPERGVKGSCRPAVAVPIEFVRPLTLDVRPILASGGTPCGAIEDAVSKLIPGQSLVVLAPFEPIPLYTKLALCGFSHETTGLPEGVWQVTFKPGIETNPERFEVCGSHDH